MRPTWGTLEVSFGEVAWVKLCVVMSPLTRFPKITKTLCLDHYHLHCLTRSQMEVLREEFGPHWEVVLLFINIGKGISSGVEALFWRTETTYFSCMPVLKEVFLEGRPEGHILAGSFVGRGAVGGEVLVLGSFWSWSTLTHLAEKSVNPFVLCCWLFYLAFWALAGQYEVLLELRLDICAVLVGEPGPVTKNLAWWAHIQWLLGD